MLEVVKRKKKNTRGEEKKKKGKSNELKKSSVKGEEQEKRKRTAKEKERGVERMFEKAGIINTKCKTSFDFEIRVGYYIKQED